MSDANNGEAFRRRPRTIVLAAAVGMAAAVALVAVLSIIPNRPEAAVIVGHPPGPAPGNTPSEASSPAETAVDPSPTELPEAAGSPTPPADRASEPQTEEPASEHGAAADHGATLWGRRFLSVWVTEDGRSRELVPGTRIDVEFEDREPRGIVRWSGGCNTTGDAVDITFERLDVLTGGLRGSTAVGCDEEGHEQDAWLERFFDSDPYWHLEGDRLWLRSGGTVIELEGAAARATSGTLPPPDDEAPTPGDH